ncbi:MAG: PqqD family peptide modification chaperone [Anaerolineae bacterium]
MEGFEDGALLLRLEDRRLLELNTTAQRILELTDGQRNAAQVAALLSQRFQISEAEALQDIFSLYEQLFTQDIIEINEPGQGAKENGAMAEAINVSSQYITNPDVVLREEDEDGGLLFNPDTNHVKVLNTTGLFIWKQCDVACILTEIAAAVQAAFEDAPADQVAEDVHEFVEGMVATGFIGTVAEPGSGGERA